MDIAREVLTGAAFFERGKGKQGAALKDRFLEATVLCLRWREGKQSEQILVTVTGCVFLLNASCELMFAFLISTDVLE